MGLVLTELVLREPLKTLWQGRDAFAEVEKLSGQVVRHKEGRETIRCDINGDIFYRKLHRGVGWAEIVKNYLQFRFPVVDASNEWNAIGKVTELGVSTMTAVGYGRRGSNPATRQSFLITRELAGVISTAEYTRHWPENPPPLRLRREMIKKMAWIARQIHCHGINHRDLYLCHFLLDLSPGQSELEKGNVNFYLVDLHRAQIREQVPGRWLVKDIASIYFSALDIGINRKDVLRFLRTYYDKPLREILGQHQGFLAKVKKRARRLYLRDFRQEPVFPL